MNLFINKIISLKKSFYFKNLITLTIGASFAQLIGILVAPILSRLYSPEDYGIFAIFASVVTILSTIFSLRYESKILIPKDENEVTTLLLLILYTTFILGGLFFFLSFFPSVLFYQSIGIFKLGFWLRFTILAAICTTLINSFYYYLTKKSLFKLITYSRIFTSAFSSFFAVILGYFFVKGGLIISQIISLLVGVIFVFFLSKFNFTKDNNNKNNIFAIAKKHKNAPIYLLPASLIDVFSYQLQIFLIALWFKMSDVGNLRMAWTILALPASFIGSAIGQLFFQKFTDIMPDLKNAKIYLFQTWRNLFFIGIIPSILVILFGKELFVIFLGQKWENSGEIASILAPMFFITFISSPTSSTYIALGIEKIGFYLNIFVLIARPLSLYIGMINNNLKLGLHIFVLLEFANILIYQFFALYYIKIIIFKNFEEKKKIEF
jgi:lipopolysaccharide exporter